MRPDHGDGGPEDTFPEEGGGLEKGEAVSLKSRYRVLFLHGEQLARLLENAFEQNRLLVEERKSLWSRIRVLREKRSRAREKTLELAGHLVALFTRDTDAEEVWRLAGLVGKELGLDRLEMWRLREASRLHRIGLVYVPESLHALKGLCFSSTVAQQFVQVPLASARLVEALDGLAGVAAVLRQLGERHDGSGGPERLKGKRILIESRILSVVLAFREGVREGLIPSEALRMLSEEACWDPGVLAALRHHGLTSHDACCRIRIWDLRPGMVLAAPIHARAGAMLLPVGTRITDVHLEKLKAYSGAGPLEEMVLIGGENVSEQ